MLDSLFVHFGFHTLLLLDLVFQIPEKGIPDSTCVFPILLHRANESLTERELSETFPFLINMMLGSL